MRTVLQEHQSRTIQTGFPGGHRGWRADRDDPCSQCDGGNDSM